MEEKQWICRKCDVELVEQDVVFEYLGRTMTHKALRCPKCASVLIPSDLAEGKIAEVELLMEDK